jgi:hypothetical protein
VEERKPLKIINGDVMQRNTTIVENSEKFPHKTKNGTII